jgi:uncharacterized protein
MESEDRGSDPDRVPEMEALSREECLALLSGHSVGRIAVTGRDDLPFVVPVNYELEGDTVVFRTDAGSKLDALSRRPVAFQLDSIDPLHHTGWSVLVQGIAHEAVPDELRSVHAEPWAGPKQHWIQIVPRHISGRRIRLPDIVYDPGGYL